MNLNAKIYVAGHRGLVGSALKRQNGDIIFDSTKPDGTMRKLMDSSRLNQLGWQSTTALDDGLKVAYEDFKKNYGFN